MCICMIYWLYLHCYILDNSAFLEFSRNCLAGDELLPGDSYICMCSGFLEEEPPGDAKRLGYFSGFADEAPGGTG